MTLFEGIIVTNLLVSVFLAYKAGGLQNDISNLYDGVALTMEKLGMVEEQDD